MEITSSISVPTVTYKSKLRHILARQWTTVLKYTVHKIYLCLYLGTDRFYPLLATLMTFIVPTFR